MSFQEMKFTALAQNAWTDASISAAEPVYFFDEGKSYFKAFALPAANINGKLRIKSFSVYPRTVFQGHLFLPRFTFLNSRFSVTRKITPSLRENRPVIGNTAWEGEVTLQPGDAFVIIHTGETELAQNVRIHDPDVGAVYAPTSGGGGVLIGNPKGNRVVPIGQTGRLEVLLHTK